MPDMCGDETFSFEGTGPKGFNAALVENGLKGPPLSNWSNIVEVFRDGESLGTVNVLEAEIDHSKKA